MTVADTRAGQEAALGQAAPPVARAVEHTMPGDARGEAGTVAVGASPARAPASSTPAAAAAAGDRSTAKREVATGARGRHAASLPLRAGTALPPAEGRPSVLGEGSEAADLAAHGANRQVPC